MKKTLMLLAFAALAGCCSYRTCNQGGHEMCYIENSGWKLFNCLMLASGDPEYPNQEVPLWFYDTVTLEVNMMLLDRVMTEKNAVGVKDLVSHVNEETIFPILFTRYSCNTSAELLK